MITIDKSRCVRCGKCSEVCPTGAIIMSEGEITVREGLCRACGNCVEACPKGAITMIQPSFHPYSIGELSGHPFKGPFRTFRSGARGGRHRHGRRRF